MRGLGRTATSAGFEEQPKNKDKELRQKLQAVHSMGAAKWKSRCAEDQEGSPQQKEAKIRAY
jgi:hypothetical protein